VSILPKHRILARTGGLARLRRDIGIRIDTGRRRRGELLVAQARRARRPIALACTRVEQDSDFRNTAVATLDASSAGYGTPGRTPQAVVPGHGAIDEPAG
jgi:hypothetical protein